MQTRILLLVLLVGGPVFSAEWSAGNGAFNDGANWSGGQVPQPTEEAAISNGGTATLADDAIDVSSLRIGIDEGESGAFVQSGGLFTAIGAFIGDTGSGTMTIDSGEFAIGNDSIHVGWRPGGVGTMNISGADAMVTSADDFQLGREGDGTLNFSAGQLRAGYTVIGKFGSGTWNQSGGLFDQDFGDIEIGDGGKDNETNVEGPRVGTLNLSGGVIQTSSHLAIGNRRGSGTVVVSGGAISATGKGDSTIFIGRGADTAPGDGGDTVLHIIGSAGIVVANGNLDMNVSEASTSSTLIAEITGPAHTPVRVSGNAEIDNGMLKVILGDYVPQPNDSWLLIEAGAEIEDDLERVDTLAEDAGYEIPLHDIAAEFGEILGEFSGIDTSMASLPVGMNWAVDYSSTMVTLMVTGMGETVPGDFNSNGVLDAADIEALTAQVNAGSNAPAFDLNGDQMVNASDRTVWVEELKNTYFGDSNLDGEFNSSDFVLVFQAGQYEDGVAQNSTWASGDWNGDGEFDSSDFVTAFQAGGFEIGPRAAVASVPEPTSGAAWLLLVFLFVRLRRR